MPVLTPHGLFLADGFVRFSRGHILPHQMFSSQVINQKSLSRLALTQLGAITERQPLKQ